MLAGMAKIEIGDAAPDLVVYDADEARVNLAELRGGRPQVALFLRHFG
jgi:peroxiredoxin